MIFDTVNECLQKFRPFGLRGIPMPWSTSSRVISFPLTVEEIFAKIVKDMEKWASTRAGKIPTEEFLLPNGELDDELLQSLREDKLICMITEEIVDRDGEWVDYEFEEVQVKIDLSDMALQILCEEVIELLA